MTGTNLSKLFYAVFFLLLYVSAGAFAAVEERKEPIGSLVMKDGIPQSSNSAFWFIHKSETDPELSMLRDSFCDDPSARKDGYAMCVLRWVSEAGKTILARMNRVTHSTTREHYELTSRLSALFTNALTNNMCNQAGERGLNRLSSKDKFGENFVGKYGIEEGFDCTKKAKKRKEPKDKWMTYGR